MVLSRWFGAVAWHRVANAWDCAAIAKKEIDMAIARWNGVVIAESDKTIVVEGNLRHCR